MIKSLKFILPVLLVAFSASCKKEGNSIKSSASSLVFTSAEQKQTVNITANCEWTASSPDCNWIICSPSSRKGSATLSITAQLNSGLERTGVVTVSGGGELCEISIKQEGIDFSASSYNVVMDENCTPVTVTILSKYDWEFTVPSAASWCTVSPMKGSAGETTVTFTPAPFTDRTPRTKQFLTVNYGSTFSMIAVSQQLPNNNPSAPELLSPEDGVADAKINGTFTWKAATDPDGDAVKYNLMLSRDNGKTWSSYSSETTSCKPSDLLEKNTKYVWKVKALDDFGGEAESVTRTFITGDGGAYVDGEIYRYQTESAGASKPVHLIIMGDGYTKDDYTDGGKFDKDVETAVSAFFGIEPFATYRNYFRISVMAVYSQESGATVEKDMVDCAAQTRNTAFSTTLVGGNSTEVSCDTDKAYTYAKKISGVTDSELQNTTILMLVNLNVYAGTCWMERTGRSVAICPVGSTFKNIVVHEGGGHGFGRLKDEYRYNDVTVPATQKALVEEWRTYDPYFAYNISFTNDKSTAHWGHFIGRAGYDAVGFYEGGMLYSKGVWRPERISCMEDNRMYYNAPSREAIVRRIFKACDKTFTLSDFYANDKVKSDNTVSTSNYVEQFVPLAPPVMIDR